jgi:hypothetical protein
MNPWPLGSDLRCRMSARVVSRHPGSVIARVRLRRLRRFMECRQLALKRRSIKLAGWSACWGEADPL